MFVYVPVVAILWILVFAVVAYFAFKFLDRLWRARKIGNITNRYALVTGCDSGFGFEIAKHLDAIGARVFAACLTEAGEKKVKEVCSTRTHTIRLDVTDHTAIKRAVDYVRKTMPSEKGKCIYISQLVRFARCCTSVLDFHSKNLQITSKLLAQGYRYHKLRKMFGKFFRSYSEILSKFGAISFQKYVSKGITHTVCYGDLVYKLRRVKCETNFISSGSKIVKRLRRRQYDPAIIERNIRLVLGPFTALCKSFLKRCTLTNKAVGTIWRALS